MPIQASCKSQTRISILFFNLFRCRPPGTAAAVRAVFHMLPVAFPLLAPSKRKQAMSAYLGGKLGFLAHFHRGDCTCVSREGRARMRRHHDVSPAAGDVSRACLAFGQFALPGQLRAVIGLEGAAVGGCQCIDDVQHSCDSILCLSPDRLAPKRLRQA